MVMTKEARQGREPTGVARVSAALWRRAWLRAALTLSPPLAWFLVIYLASLVVMLVTAFWTVNPFTNNLQHQLSLTNFGALFDAPIPAIIGRTVLLAALVTVTDAVLALPVRVLHGPGGHPQGAQRSVRGGAPAPMGELPRPCLRLDSHPDQGRHARLGDRNASASARRTSPIRTSPWGSCSVTSGCPFMILPVYAALERIPDSFIEASADLGPATRGRCAASCSPWPCRASSPGRSLRSR